MKIVKLMGLLAVAVCMAAALTTAVADTAAGKAIYDGKGACGSCHGLTGKGDAPAAAALNPKPRSFAEGTFKYDTDGDGAAGTENDLFNVIKMGTAVYGGAPTMPARADIPDDEVKALVAYILSLKN